MQIIKIGTDSTADIPKQICEELNITVLPLSLFYNGKEYIEGIDITPQEYYDILENCENIPTSSQVPSHLYTEFYTKTFEEGYTDLIQVSLNSKGSGTYQAAVLAKDLFYEENPEAKGKFNIHNIDSETYSMIYGYPVVEAAKMVKSGVDAETPEDIVLLTAQLNKEQPKQ